MADKKSSLVTNLEVGAIASFYTEKGWFVRVYPALGIDKVKFSFKEKGKESSFDIWIDSDDFDILADEILSGAMERAIANDNGQYPNAWKIVNGENGSHELAIGKGQKGIVIQGRDKNSSKNAFVPVLNYRELKKMAKWWRRISAKYYEERAGLCLKAMDAASKYYRKDAENYGETSHKAENTESGNNTASSPNPATTSSDTSSEMSIETVCDSFRTKNKLQRKEGYTYLHACRRDDAKPKPVVFLDQYVNDEKRWDEFMNAVINNVNVTFRMNYYEQNGKYMFKSFAS